MLKLFHCHLLTIVLGLALVQTSYAQTTQDETTNPEPKTIDEPTCISSQTGYKDGEIWLDKARRATHRNLCNTVAWFDGLFGHEKKFEDEKFKGKVIFGWKHDEMEGFDPKLRIKIKSKLPNASDKFNAFIGRVEEEDFISNSEIANDSFSNVGLRSTEDDDAEWLIGLGYKNPKFTNRGFDFSVGAKISSGFKPYAKIRHRYLYSNADPHFFRTTQTLFWRKEKGYGVSTDFNYTYLIDKKNIFETGFGARFTEKDDQWEWITSSTWHHSLTDKKGISSRIYVRGEEENEVSIPEYGMTFTYRQPFLRPWFYIETGVDFRWEKETELSDRESAVRFGLQGELVLGDYYNKKRKK
jgi:hypothetical protein